jgi:hypothetical protein
MPGPAWTVERVEELATGARRVLVRYAGGRRVNVYIPANEVSGPFIEKLVTDIAPLQLPPQPLNRKA